MKQFLFVLLLSSAHLSIAQTILTGNIGNYTITSPGTYRINGLVVGNITVATTSAGNVVIEGMNSSSVLQGIPWAAGTPRHVSHFSGKVRNNNTLTWRNLELRGHNHNLMEGTGNCIKNYVNLELINHDRIEGGVHYEDVGGVNGGKNSSVSNSSLAVGDDAIKITSQNSSAANADIVLSGNGSAIQLGWNDRCKGNNHTANNISISGFLHPNLSATVDNESIRPARSIVAGIVQNNVQNINITNLDIDVSNYRHLIKFLVQSGPTTTNPSLDDVLIQGSIPDDQLYNNGNIKAISIVAKPGSQVNNFVIDMGCAIQNPIYHYISGDVDVAFIGCPTSNVEYIGGVLQTPLPVDLISFNVALTEQQWVELNWRTASEINNDYFAVERSLDARNWETIATIQATTNNMSLSDYAFTDKQALNGLSYYRLKQTDIDGSYTYSKTQSIVVDSPIEMYPNPFSSKVVVNEDVAINEIQVYNQQGQNVSTQIQMSKNANPSVLLDFSNLSAGTYYIHTKHKKGKAVCMK